MSSLDEIFLHSETTDNFIRQFMGSVVLASKTSNTIPNGKDFQYYSNLKTFSTLLHNNTESVGELLEKLLSFIQPKSAIDLPDDLTDPCLYDYIVDIIDNLLENADIKLDSILGNKKISKPIQFSLKMDKERILHSNTKDIPKPQLSFMTEIDNSRDRPFRPRLRVKPHGQVPLDFTEYLLDATDTDYVGPRVYYRHPYETEIRKLKYLESQIADPSNLKPWIPSPLQPFEFVDNEDDFIRILDELVQAQEIAVDLEHHSYRSFQGLTCLMQISTRHKDFVLDALELRQHLHLLGGVFANPAIVKVFHGCDSDILWLQRDFGLYVVNCFDTFHAAKMLKYPTLSLSHLVKYHCGASLNKKHQLADWRERPLSDEMLLYAKLDTHYLLHVYDCLRQGLWRRLGREGLEATLDATRNSCLRRYEKDAFYPLGYRKLLSREEVQPSAQQEAVLAALWQWRDLAARHRDESVDFVMSNSQLVQLGLQPQEALAGPLPDEVRQLLQQESRPGPSPLAPQPAPAVPAAARTPPRRSLASCTFTPAVVPLPPSATSSHGSPLLAPDEIFRIAGWNSPSPRPSPSPTELDPLIWPGGRPSVPVAAETTGSSLQRAFREATDIDVVNKENMKRLQAAQFQIQQLFEQTAATKPTPVVEGDSRQPFAPVEPPPPPIAVEKDKYQLTSSIQIGEGDDRVLIEVPSSFEQIYEISNRNRKRNREKKKHKEEEEDAEGGDGDAEDSQPPERSDTAVQSASKQTLREAQQLLGTDAVAESPHFDPEIYFACAAASNESSGDASAADTSSTLDFAQSLGWLDARDRQRLEEGARTEQSDQQAAAPKTAVGGAIRSEGRDSGPQQGGQAFDFSRVPPALSHSDGRGRGSKARGGANPYLLALAGAGQRGDERQSHGPGRGRGARQG